MPSLRPLLELFGPRKDPDRLDNLDKGIAPWAFPIYHLFERYFRAQVKGLDNIPPGKAIIAGNHNSGITFFEPIIFGRHWHLRCDGDDDVFFLVHDAMVALPVLGNLLMKCGAVRASREAAGRIFAAGRKIVVFPGGNAEAFRPWTERHMIQFGGHKGFVRMALRHHTPIVPMANVGGHSTFFVLWRGAPLARITGAKKVLRSDSFPLFVGLPWGLGLGPWFHLPLPARMTIAFGQPIHPEKVAGTDDYDPEDPELVDALYHEVVDTLQAMMDRYR